MLSSSYGGFAIADAKSIPVDAIDGLSSRNLQDILIELSLRKPSPIPPGSPDYIANGLNISLNTGLNITSSAGRAVISETLVQAVQQGLLLDARMVAIVYLKQDGTIDKVNGVFPEVDANTIVRYVIDGSATIANSAVGVNGNTIAVANNLTKSGTVASVDGWIGIAGAGDGSTGYYASANSTGFPIGTNEKEISLVFTPLRLSGEQMWVAYGNAPTGATEFSIYTATGGQLGLAGFGVDLMTGYVLEIGKTYYVTIQNNSGVSRVFVNGLLVVTAAHALNTTAGLLFIGRINAGDAIYRAQGIFHFVELRNKMHTPEQISDIANKMCLPCQYIAHNATYPVLSATDLASAYHEWKYDETSGTSVADSKGTLNGTATGTTIIDSDIGLGKARNFSSTSDYITCPAFAFSSDWTIIRIGKNTVNANWCALMDNRSGSGANSGMWIGYDGSGKFGVGNNSVTVTSTNVVSINKTSFHVAVSKNNLVSFMIDSPIVDNTANLVTSTASSALIIGRDYLGANSLRGTADYLLYVPRALDPAEIREIYNTLMATTPKDISSILPADTISLARVNTDLDSVIDINQDPSIGREEGAVPKWEFLGWKPFSGGGFQVLTWNNNPFGTRKFELYATWAQDANGTLETLCPAQFNTGASWYGLQRWGTVNGSIKVETQTHGVAIVDGVWKTSGFIGVYVRRLV